MSFLRIVVVIFGLIISGPATWAGEAYEDKVKCPIGGKRMLVSRSTGCTTWGSSITMSLRQPSSCDFVTRLPVCDRQAFPAYRVFSQDEVAKLKSLVKADWYQDAKSQSRYFRAYLIEKELGTFTEERLFWLLQNGHWYDPEQTFGNKEYFSAFRTVANDYLKVANQEEWEVILLTAAFARVHSAEPQKARPILNAAKEHQTGDQPILAKYAQKIEFCIDQPKAKECDPEYLIEAE